VQPGICYRISKESIVVKMAEQFDTVSFGTVVKS